MAFQFGVCRQVGCFERYFSGHPFLVAKNSESCLNQLLGKREVRSVDSIRSPFLGFQTSN
ncbi:TPA: hypothetical protein I7701_22735 [Vibrio vulnificus]|nr:hypothetical protein [Vibrio vulnificus]